MQLTLNYRIWDSFKVHVLMQVSFDSSTFSQIHWEKSSCTATAANSIKHLRVDVSQEQYQTNTKTLRRGLDPFTLVTM